MNTVDLVKMASDRSYMGFETAALEMLKVKLSENGDVKAYKSKLNVAKGLDEACKDEKNEEEDEGKEKELEEQEDEGKEKEDGEKSDKDDSGEKDDKDGEKSDKEDE